jgi:ectoine hydroxylase-related dioxygenase (phytanoyl-CoA dioxygenase family)
MPGGHEDGYLSSSATEDEQTGTYDYHTVGATAYLTDVAPHGGGFSVFPGSHRIVADYFKDHALNSLGWQACPPAIAESGGWDYDRRLDDQLDAKAIPGDSGTVILWHMRLLHGVSINQDISPRVALITRFTHEQGDSIKHDAVPNLWKYWEAIPEAEPNELET